MDPATRLAARSRRRRIPPENVFTRRSPTSARPAARAARSARFRTLRLRQVVEAPTISRFARAVSRSSTVADWPGHADALAHPRALGRHVVAATRASPEVRLRQRRQDADCGRLAGAVVAQQAEHGSRRELTSRRRGGPRGRRTCLLQPLGDNCVVVSSFFVPRYVVGRSMRASGVRSTLYEMSSRPERSLNQAGPPARPTAGLVRSRKEPDEVILDARGARHARAGLSREQIGATALKIADAEGFDELFDAPDRARELGAADDEPLPATFAARTSCSP